MSIKSVACMYYVVRTAHIHVYIKNELNAAHASDQLICYQDGLHVVIIACVHAIVTSMFVQDVLN